MGYLSTRRGAEATTALIQRLLDPATRERAIEAIAVNADERVDGVLTALETADTDSAPLLMSALTRMRRPSSQAAIAAALAFRERARPPRGRVSPGRPLDARSPRSARPCDLRSGPHRAAS